MLSTQQSTKTAHRVAIANCREFRWNSRKWSVYSKATVKERKRAARVSFEPNLIHHIRTGFFFVWESCNLNIQLNSEHCEPIVVEHRPMRRHHNVQLNAKDTKKRERTIDRKCVTDTHTCVNQIKDWLKWKHTHTHVLCVCAVQFMLDAFATLFIWPHRVAYRQSGS